MYQFFPACKLPAVIAFSLKDAPETFHRTIVDALADSWHALGHTSSYYLLVELKVCILEASVTVKQRMCIRIILDRQIERSEDQWIVISISNHIWHDTSVAKIKNGTEIDFMLDEFCAGVLIPFEFSNICDPFLIRLFGMELSVQYILCYVRWITCVSCATSVPVLDRWFEAFDPAYPKNSLPIDFEPVFAGRTYKVIMYPAVSFGVVLCVDFLDPFSDTLILADSISYLSIEPVIVCRSWNMNESACRFNRIRVFLTAFFDGRVNVAESYLWEASLLSTSSNFFNRSRSILVI